MSPSCAWRAGRSSPDPWGDKKFWGFLRDIASLKVVIKGLISHYVNTMRSSGAGCGSSWRLDRRVL
ncbi:MAG: hypothetical protein AB1679_00510 [Actinomycetota bacterium]